jgi:hypothetical protein
MRFWARNCWPSHWRTVLPATLRVSMARWPPTCRGFAIGRCRSSNTHCRRQASRVRHPPFRLTGRSRSPAKKPRASWTCWREISRSRRSSTRQVSRDCWRDSKPERQTVVRHDPAVLSDIGFSRMGDEMNRSAVRRTYLGLRKRFLRSALPSALSQSRSFKNSNATYEAGAVDGRADLDNVRRGRKPEFETQTCT